MSNEKEQKTKYSVFLKVLNNTLFTCAGAVIATALVSGYYQTEGIARGYAVYGKRVGLTREVIWLVDPTGQKHLQEAAEDGSTQAGATNGNEANKPPENTSSESTVPPVGIVLLNEGEKDKKQCVFDAKKKCCLDSHKKCVKGENK